MLEVGHVHGFWFRAGGFFRGGGGDGLDVQLVLRSEKFAHQFLSPGFMPGGVEGQGLIAGDHQVVVVYRGQLRPGKFGVEGPAFFFLEEGQE